MAEIISLDVDLILRLIQSQNFNQLSEILRAYHPADIADLLDALPPDDAVTVFGLLPIEIGSEVLDETGSLVRQELIDKINDDTLADLLDELPMDDAAEILEDLPEPMSDHLLGLMEPEEAEEVRKILSFGEDSAGRLMSTDIAALQKDWNISQAIDYLHSLDEIETLYYLYVTDQQNKLIGVVPLRGLLLSQPDQSIESIMQTGIISLPASADQEELAEAVAKYDFVALPVVDNDGRLLGVVTVDDVLDIVEEEATEDIQRLGGSQPLEQPYFASSITNVFSKRIGWLLLLFVAGTLTGLVTRAYENVWGQFLVLASFVPLIIGTGGNTGSQTIATIIRAITMDEVKFRNIGRAWAREVSIGLLLGLVMSAIAFGVAIYLWGTSWKIALTVSLTFPIIVTWSTTVGTIIPIVADRIGIDPAVISGPMISTIVDVTGLIIYYTLAAYILGIY